MKKKKLLIDYTSAESYFIRGTVTGVGRSTIELINALNRFYKIPFEIILFSQNIKGIGCKNSNTKFSKIHFYFPKRKPFNHICNILNIRRFFSHYDLMHIPHNTDGYEILSKTIFTIHDLIVYRYPEMWGLTEKQVLEHKKIAKGCKAIVTCSNASKRDIVKYWEVSPNKVTVIPWGVNRNIFFPDYSSVANKYDGINRNFFFCTSCNHPRKQAKLILKSFRRYIENGGSHQLVMLGVKDSDLEGYEDLIYDKKHSLVILKGVSDEDLRLLYSNAKASIVASLYEGFGLPVLESLACHTQVICAKNSSLIEAGGDVVDYLFPLTEESLCERMLDYEKLEKDQTMDISSIEDHLNNFTWDKTAKAYVEFYNKLLNE